MAKSPSVNSQQQQTHIYARSGNLLTAFNGRLAELCDEKERRLRTHVAVLCSPSLAAHTQCLAGDDGRFVDQRLREHYLEGLRRAVQMVGPGGSCGRSVWLFLSVVLQWRSRVDLQYGSCGADPPLSTVASGILFYASWTNPIGINGRRAGGKLQLACNGDTKTSIKVCGERSD